MSDSPRQLVPPPEFSGRSSTATFVSCLDIAVEGAVPIDDLDTAGSMAAAKAAGKVRMEGKDYVMQDGDVVEFRSGVPSGSKK